MNVSLIVENGEKIQKSVMCAKKNFIWNPAICAHENVKYLENIIDDSVITCDKILNAADSVSANITSAVSTNFYNKKA